MAACCRWPPSEGRVAAVRGATAGSLDWERVLRIACRQRVEGLVNDGIVRAGLAPPAPVAAAFGARGSSILRKSMMQAAESMRLRRLVEAAGIEVMVLKGVAVEWLAYGRLGLKSASDIDLLVTPPMAARARDLLIDDGYVLVEPPGLTPERFETWVGLSKECEFKNRTSGFNVELHWRLTDNPTLLRGLSVNSDSQVVAVTADAGLRTLAAGPLYSYLCVHGAMHGWSRLKWLADVGALLSRETGDGVARLHECAGGLGAGVCSAQTLLLCERLFQTPLPEDLAAEFRASARVKRLVEVALRAMAGGEGEVEIEDRPFAAGLVALSHFSLGVGWRYALDELGRKWIGVSDRMSVPLPRPLHFLYHLLRVPSWVLRRLSGRKTSV